MSTREPILKKCAECHQTKELCFFHKDRNGKHGRTAKCADCRNTRKRERYANDENWAQIKREYNARNGRLKRDLDRVSFSVNFPSFP